MSTQRLGRTASKTTHVDGDGASAARNQAERDGDRRAGQACASTCAGSRGADRAARRLSRGGRRTDEREGSDGDGSDVHGETHCGFCENLRVCWVPDIREVWSAMTRMRKWGCLTEVRFGY